MRIAKIDLQHTSDSVSTRMDTRSLPLPTDTLINLDLRGFTAGQAAVIRDEIQALVEHYIRQQNS